MADVKWFKITTDMFDDEKIKIIESMPDRDTILIIWIKLISLAAKINENGWIFLTEEVPYDENTLATVLNRPINTVKLALGLFAKYKMIETGDNGTLLITNFEKHQNIEGLEKIREQGRLRTARFREKLKLLPQGNVTVMLRNAPDKNRKRIDKIREEKYGIKSNNQEGVVYKENGGIDEIKTIIHHQSLYKVRQALTGKVPCLEANKKIYRKELKRLGIKI